MKAKINLKNIWGIIRILSVLGMLTLGAASSHATPSVLFCSPYGLEYGIIDLDYLRELNSEGYQVDYTESLEDVTWDRIRQ